VKILLTTFGSLGDLHPYIAVGKGLRERGHSVVVGTAEIYRAKVEGEGLAFHAVQPDMAGVINDPEVMRHAFHPRTGTEYVLRKMFLPYFEQAFEDTLAAVRDVDLIVSHPLTCAVPLVAELTKTPWVSVALAPAIFWSAYDPPTVPGVDFLELFRNSGPWFWRTLWSLVRRRARPWGDPVSRLRAKLGLAARDNPILDDMCSPLGTQAWFSKVLAQPQADWPAKTTVTGFPFYDRQEVGMGMSSDLRRFLDSGPAPVVFTLGSSAVFHAGDFYRESAEAARMAGVRAVMLIGTDARNLPVRALGDSVFLAEYAPYSELLPHAAATVHQGGVGTTAQALRAGRPMIVVPWSHDQPDNARRVANLGVARVVPRGKYRAARMARELRTMLDGASYRAAASRTAAEMAGEDGVGTACDGIERIAQAL
jgi:UDP:flavonoid glycosyltransferase YjiC (YdhE family)